MQTTDTGSMSNAWRPGGTLADGRLHSPIVIFGECLLDRFGQEAIPGGAPFNVARHLAALGFDPLFVTRIGADAEGASLRAGLDAFGVRGDGIQVDAWLPSGQVRVHAAPAGHAFEILADQAYDAIEPAALPAELTQQSAWLYFGTLAQRAAKSRAALGDLRGRLRHRAFVDLNWRSGQVPPALALSMLDQADILKASAEELDLLLAWSGISSMHTGRPALPGTRCAGIAALLADRRTGQLIVTHGANGYAVWDNAGCCEFSGAGVAVANVVDTVGAGDAFSAIALAGLLLAWPLNLTLARANAFAATICSLRGAAPADTGFYAPWIRRWHSAG